MKAAKWLKWKIGTVCTILLVLVFQLVRSSPQFQLQIDQVSASKAAPGSQDLRSDDGDSVMREWQDQETSTGDYFQQEAPRGGRRFSRHGGQDGMGSMGSQSQSDGGSDTRTSRS